MALAALEADAAPAAIPRVRYRQLGGASAGLGTLAAVLAAAGSWIPSLWGDEATSVMSGTRPLVSLLGMLSRVDAVHGLYYTVLHGWIEVFGSSPFSVRLPSAIGVGICAAAVVWLCGRVVGLRTAVLSGVFAAVLPRLTYAGEEARSYAFDAALAAILCAIVVEIMLRRPTGKGWWIAYGAVLAVGTYSFLYLGLMALPAGVAMWTDPAMRVMRRRWLRATLAGLACATPLYVLAVLQHHQIAYLEKADAVTPASVFVQTWFSDGVFATVAWTLIAVAGLAFAADALRAGGRGRFRDASVVHLEPLLLAWLILPMGVLIAVNVLIADFTSRYGTFAAPAAALLMALGVRRIARATRSHTGGLLAAVVLTAVVLIAAAPVWASQRTPYAKNGSDWNEIADVISRDARPGDGIVFDAAARPSRQPRLAMDTEPAAFRSTRDLLLRKPYVRAAYWWDETYSIPQAAAHGRFIGVARIWLVEYTDSRTPDSWGLTSLTRLGYHPQRRIDEHRSRIWLLTRSRLPSAG